MALAKVKERDACFIVDLKTRLERSIEELKIMENERRAVDIAAAKMRGRATAQQEALLTDQRAADARGDKYMNCAVHVLGGQVQQLQRGEPGHGRGAGVEAVL